jgi:putative peptidoglycan lipid II flippase
LSQATPFERQPFLHALMVVFGGTLAVQAIAFLRQLVIASAFGVDRAMDIYLLVFGIASVIGFGLGTVMENATVPLLVARLEKGDRTGFGQVALRVLIIGAGLAVAAALVFLAAVPLVARFVTTGLTAAERQAMGDLSWWFLPWILICVPYYAVASLLKAESRFRRFMTAEVIVTIVSLVILLYWRPGVEAIAIAYGLGYGAALLSMLPGLAVPLRLGRRDTGQSWGVVRQITRFAAVNQVATLGLLADRFLASYLPSGAIAAGSYASLITGQVSALLGFREAFMVPLSEERDRAGKLERMICGLLMLAIPIAAFICFRSEAILSVLLERGRFDRGAVALASEMLTIQALAIPAAVILLPMYRVLQILGRMRFAGYLLLAGAAMTLALGSLLMFGQGMGLSGYLLANLIVSHATLLIAVTQLWIAGVRPSFLRAPGLALYAILASAAGLWLAGQWAPDAARWLMLLKDGVIFSLVYGAFCLAILPRLRRIVADIRETATPATASSPSRNP